MIVDIHTHIPPDRHDWPGFLRAMRSHGISHFVVLPIAGFAHYPTPEKLVASNDLCRAFAESADGVFWFVYLNPQNEGALAELDRCAGLGAAGVKLWVSLKDVHGSTAAVHPILARAGELGLPVLVHTFDRWGGNLAGEIDLEEFAQLAEAHPQTTMIGAHTGADWRAAMGILRGRAANAVVDICGSFPELGMVEAIVADLGAERVLYGSDAAGRSVPSQLAKVVFADLTAAAKHQILYANAAKLLGLPAAEPAYPTSAIAEQPFAAEDHFCFCGDWPFFPSACRTAAELSDALLASGVTKAYVGDLGSIYGRDLIRSNESFLEAARAMPVLTPLATINPTNQNWRQVLAQAQRHFAGGILFPELHGWQLDAPRSAELFQICAQRRWPLWLNLGLGDPRFRHSGVADRPVEHDELRAFIAAAPANDYVIQALPVANAEAVVGQALSAAGRFRFEISRFTDFYNGEAQVLRRLLAEFGATPFVHGSEFPLRHLDEVRWAAGRILTAAQPEQAVTMAP